MSQDIRWLDRLEMRGWRGFLAATSRLLARLDAEMQGTHQLSVADYGILATLSEASQQRLRMAELADRMMLSPSGLTRRVDTLVAGGMVQRVRCPEDRRGTFAALTPKGLRQVEEAAPDHVARVRRYFVDRLDRYQLVALVEVTEAILAGLPDAPATLDP